MIKIATAIIVAALFSTCRSVGRSPLVLDNDIWVAVEGVGGDSAAAWSGTAGAKPSLEFLSDGQLVGYTSCNSFFGSYTTQRGGSATPRLDISIEGITMALCPDDEMERDYIERLGRVCSYSVSDARLLLKDSTGQTILVFTPSCAAYKNNQ